MLRHVADGGRVVAVRAEAREAACVSCARRRSTNAASSTVVLIAIAEPDFDAGDGRLLLWYRAAAALLAGRAADHRPELARNTTIALFQPARLDAWINVS